jgi:hypothetical protein
LSTQPFNGTGNSSGLIPIDSSNIAWKSDVDYKFKNQPISNWQDIQWLNIENCKYLQCDNFRTFYRMDAHCWSTQLQKALRCHQLKPWLEHLLPPNCEQLQHWHLLRLENLRSFDYKFPRGIKLLPSYKLYRRRLAVSCALVDLLRSLYV